MGYKTRESIIPTAFYIIVVMEIESVGKQITNSVSVLELATH